MTLYDDGFVVAAVSWSGWDGAALKSLAAYLEVHSGPSVALFNADDTTAEPTAARLLGFDVQPYALPAIAQCVKGRLVRVEQGMRAVNWMQALANS